MFAPRDGQPPKELPAIDGAAVGAAASPTDMGTTGVSGAAQTAKEGFGSFVEGLVKGSLSDNDSWSATLGSVVGGLIPGIGLAADIRDLGAAVGHVVDGKQGAWLELGASIIGFVPGGDIAKGIAKGATKAVTKTATKVGAELADDAAKLLKGSTATAADGLTGAQKTAGHVHPTPPNPSLSLPPATPTPQRPLPRRFPKRRQSIADPPPSLPSPNHPARLPLGRPLIQQHPASPTPPSPLAQASPTPPNPLHVGMTSL